MATSIISPIELCPINFKKFGELNRIVGSLEETILLAKIKFHQQGTKLIKAGRPAIARSRKEIHSWFGFSQRKTDALLSSLNKKGLLYKSIGMFFGKKRLFLTASNKVTDVPINMSLLDVLIDETGSLKNALLYSRIAFGCNIKQTCQDDTSYQNIKKEDLSKWLGVSLRTLDSLIEILLRKGLILKKNLVTNGKRQMHFKIPESSLKVLVERFKKVLKKNEHNAIQDKQKTQSKGHQADIPHKKKRRPASCKTCREEPAKMQTSIKVRTNNKKTINNIRQAFPKQQSRTQQKNCSKKGGISFSLSTLGEKLSPKQTEYLKSALKRTIYRSKLKVSNLQSLLDQLAFSLTNKQHLKGVKNFEHAVSRFMKIITQGNWRTPIGFYNHDEKGRALKAERQKKETDWLQLKKKDAQGSHADWQKVNNIYTGRKASEKECLTAEACDIACQLKKLQERVGRSIELDISVTGLVDIYMHRLKDLFYAGADKNTVTQILKKVR